MSALSSTTRIRGDARRVLRGGGGPAGLEATAALPPRRPWPRWRRTAPCASRRPVRPVSATSLSAREPRTSSRVDSLSAVIVPPCSSTSSLTSASPIPEPSWVRALAPARDGSARTNAGARSGMPVPVSLTEATASPLREWHTAIFPSKVNLNAFEIRFKTIFSHMSWSTKTGWDSGGPETSSGRPPARWPSEKHWPDCGPTRQVGGRNDRLARPASIREKSSSVLTSFVRRRALRCTSNQRSASAGGSGSRARRQRVFGGPQQEGQRGPELVAHVAEERGLRAIDLGKRFRAPLSLPRGPGQSRATRPAQLRPARRTSGMTRRRRSSGCGRAPGARSGPRRSSRWASPTPADRRARRRRRAGPRRFGLPHAARRRRRAPARAPRPRAAPAPPRRDTRDLPRPASGRAPTARPLRSPGASPSTSRAHPPRCDPPRRSPPAGAACGSGGRRSPATSSPPPSRRHRRPRRPLRRIGL